MPIDELLLELLLDHFIILGRALTQEEMSEKLGTNNAEVELGLKRLEARDAIVLDERSEVLAAYPYSNRPTIHKVEVAGKTVFANCAVDALGIPFMVGEDAIIESECIQCRTPVMVTIQDSQVQSCVPSDIRVWYTSSQESLPSLTSQCKSINFFCTQNHLHEWKRTHPHQIGKPLNLNEASQLGKRIFGKSLPTC
jgi:hypothetical protein